MSDRQIGPFELDRVLGRGGMGVVYLATYTKTGQKVAVKVLPEELSEDAKMAARFDRELSILKKLQHPNIVRCFGGGKHQGRRFYAMELLPGGTIGDILKQQSRIPWDQVLQYGKQVCAGLQHAHEQGIIHRDLKPANLMLAKDGSVKLADFGIARDTAATALTAAGKTVGTYAYMSPEQITGTDPSHKADLYSLGCVFYEMLTGRPPFEANSPGELFFAHMQKKPSRVTTVMSQTVAETVLECPVWLDGLIMQLLEKSPDDRPFDALAVSVALEDIERKVAQGAGVLSELAGGQPSSISLEGTAGNAQALLRKKKKSKSNRNQPIWESTWFLGSALLLVVAFAVWMLWPLGEDQLFARAQKLMASENNDDWDRAVRDYITPLRSRFPNGKYASEVQSFVDKVEMRAAERRVEMTTKLRRDPKDEGERLYIQAHKFEVFGDRISALESYEHMVQVLGDDEKLRPFVNLARRQIATISAQGGTGDDRQKLVKAALIRAEKAYSDGKTLEARKTWESLVGLYGENRELQPLIDRARLRLDGKDAPPLSDDNEPATETNPADADPSDNKTDPADADPSASNAGEKSNEGPDGDSPEAAKPRSR